MPLLPSPPIRKQVVFSSTAAGGPAQLYKANVDGTGFHRVTNSGAIEVEAKINPKTGADIVDVSGRSGLPQIYKMNTGRRRCPAPLGGYGRSHQSRLESRWLAYRLRLDERL